VFSHVSSWSRLADLPCLGPVCGRVIGVEEEVPEKAQSRWFGLHGLGVLRDASTVKGLWMRMSRKVFRGLVRTSVVVGCGYGVSLRY
jgi:hypothetical protein